MNVHFHHGAMGILLPWFSPTDQYLFMVLPSSVQYRKHSCYVHRFQEFCKTLNKNSENNRDLYKKTSYDNH